MLLINKDDILIAANLLSYKTETFCDENGIHFWVGTGNRGDLTSSHHPLVDLFPIKPQQFYFMFREVVHMGSAWRDETAHVSACVCVWENLQATDDLPQRQSTFRAPDEGSGGQAEHLIQIRLVQSVKSYRPEPETWRGREGGKKEKEEKKKKKG